MPISCVADAWIGKKLSTTKNSVNYFVRMLNYITFEQVHPIDDFSEVTQDMILNYFNYLSKKSSQNYVETAERTITKAMYYLVERNLLNNFSKEDFIAIRNKKDKTIVNYLACIHNKYALPPKKSTKKLHNVNLEVVFKMIEISIEICPAISLAMYCQAMGGLRASEVLSVEYSDISYNANNTSFMINIYNKDLRPDISSGFIAQAKKTRKQLVFIVDGLFDKVYTINKTLTQNCKSNAICIDNNGNPMIYQTYRKNVNKVKKELIKRLEKSEDIDTKLYARYLNSQDWSTHIFRGVYSNLVAAHTNNPLEVVRFRGDSAISSALPYLENTNELINEISGDIQAIYDNK